ncbi:hypothetical protein IAI10_13375 [Clostridium sp. 19966]|uniref:hypothetical protein n=1 Tax=Clostridium sp. 19966 TaxID=2768166 RepID=UPI0028DE7885|nr:hypothetical protein [Clostridium sp. 19966]MDT8717657.1 hypothetical protein [Clostridium sp. 19966]
MVFASIFITVILLLPMIGLLLYGIFYPRDAAMMGKRWQFKNQNLEPSEEYIKHCRVMSIVVLVLLIVISIFAFLK